MKTVTGLFDTREQAHAAVDALEDAGIGESDISIVSQGADDEEDTSSAIGIGTAVGGVGGLLAGLGAFAIPGIGPVVGAGWLATTLVGAAAGGVAGGIIGALNDAGIDEDDAHVYAEGVRRGGSVVIARVEEGQTDAAAAILGGSGSVDITERREAYRSDGWSEFDHAAEPVAPNVAGHPDGPRPVIVPPPNR